MYYCREKRHGYLEHYKAILKDYQEKYASFQHSKVLSEKKAAAEELERKLQASLERKLQLKEQCDKQKGINHVVKTLQYTLM